MLEEEEVLMLAVVVGTLGVGVVGLAVLVEVVLTAGAGLVLVVSGAGLRLGWVLVLVVVCLGHDLLSVLFSEVDFVAELALAFAERGRACADEDDTGTGDF